MASIFKRHGKGLTFREQAKLPGPWQCKIKLGLYRYKRIRLCNDANASRSWLRELQHAIDRKRRNEPAQPEKLEGIPRKLLERLGLANRLAETRGKAWDGHVDDYAAELLAKGCNSTYAENARRYLKAIAKDQDWETLDDANRDDLLDYLEKRKSEGASARTANNIRAYAIAFLQWATKVRRADRNDLLTVEKTNEKGKRKRVRRSLSIEDCIKLLSVAGQRELVYRVGLATGLRHRELRLLEWRDVRIDGDDSARPYLALRPEATKSQRADEVPLSNYITERLRDAKPPFALPTTRVFKRVPTFNTWKRDLGNAGISYHDDQKRIAGFHSLRVSLGTELERIGTPRAVRHWIMRHIDPSVSYSSYVDRERLDAWEVVNRLPTYPLLAQELRKTGTA